MEKSGGNSVSQVGRRGWSVYLKDTLRVLKALVQGKVELALTHTDQKCGFARPEAMPIDQVVLV